MGKLFYHFARRGASLPPASNPPVNTVAPALSGTPNFGQSLSVSNGTWTNSPTNYAYQWNRGGVAIAGETASTHTVATADVGATITCTVTAINAAGSASANSNSVIGAAIAPAAIANLAVASTTSTSATLTWSRPNGNGRNPVDYTIQFKLSSDTSWTTFSDGVSNATGAVVIGLASGRAYDFRVTSTNDNGFKLSSDTSWTTFSDGVSNATGAVVIGLASGRAYDFRVTSTNDNGSGDGGTSPASNIATGSTVDVLPAAVSTLAAGTPTSGTVPLTWSAPTNTGSAITDYVVQYKASKSSTWLTFADGTSSATGATVTGLLATTSYDFRIVAVNGAGTGPASNVVTTSTIAPFTSDANTFWWDFSSVPDILTNTAGTETIAYVRERIGNKTPLVQTLKDLQPLKVSAGMDFNQSTLRILKVDDVTGLTNGTLGWYFATNYKPTIGGGVLLSIGRNASLVASRGSVEFSSSRIPLLRLGNSEASSISAIANAPAQTLGVTMTLEVLLDTVNDTVSMWINGVSQTLTGTVPSMPTFPSTDPIAISLGNAITSGAATSADGSQQQAIFYNGIPSTGARSSISSYLNSVRQA